VLLIVVSYFADKPLISTLVALLVGIVLLPFVLWWGIRSAEHLLRISHNPSEQLLGDKEKWFALWRERPDKIVAAAHYDFSGRVGPKILVLRGVDDEASFTLAAGAIGSRLSTLKMEIREKIENYSCCNNWQATFYSIRARSDSCPTVLFWAVERRGLGMVRHRWHVYWYICVFVGCNSDYGT
jgi:hypothetical protein